MEKKKLIIDPAIRHFLMTILFLIIVSILQGIGTILVEQTVDSWYLTLKKPSWTPPNAVFGPVWMILYVIIALVGYIIWTRPQSKVRSFCFVLWILQLFFNGLWTYFFFSFKSPSLGLLDLILVIILTGIVMFYGKRLHKAVFYLLIPYFLWLVYAGAINLWILIHN